MKRLVPSCRSKRCILKQMDGVYLYIYIYHLLSQVFEPTPLRPDAFLSIEKRWVASKNLHAILKFTTEKKTVTAMISETNHPSSLVELDSSTALWTATRLTALTIWPPVAELTPRMPQKMDAIFAAPMARCHGGNWCLVDIFYGVSLGFSSWFQIQSTSCISKRTSWFSKHPIEEYVHQIGSSLEN